MTDRKSKSNNEYQASPGVKKEESSATPKVMLRTYRESDWEEVKHLYTSTQVPLVFESIRSKLRSPATWLVWFIVYACFMFLVPQVILYFYKNFHPFLMLIVLVIITLALGAFSFAVLFIGADNVEIQSRVDEAMANDLADPNLYYLNYMNDENGEKVKKPVEEQQPSHFWVLTLDGDVCGMIGLSCNTEDVKDKRKTVLAGWKCMVTSFSEQLHLPTPSFLFKKKRNDRIFAHKQIPKTATITRWAVRNELQECGFSTLLINRAMTWAKEHDINRVYAMTNETSTAAEKILVKRHGFVLMKRFNLNFFGQHNKLFGVRVNEWIEKNGEEAGKPFQKTS